MIAPNEGNCTGCMACYTICPNNAISLIINDHGFCVPSVDKNACIECGICDKVCPEQTSFTRENIGKTYAFINLDAEERYQSTSGGFFIAAAKSFLERGGFVCGCVLRKMHPMHIITNKIDEIYMMQGSKYVQSEIGNCFSEIEDLVKQSIPVLFTGTSCQVAGLKNYMRMKKIDESSLMCIDFLCHGVPSVKIWDDYVRYYEELYKKKAIDYKFRSKKYGWGKNALGGDYFSYFVLLKGKEKNDTDKIYIDDKRLYVRLWRYIFFSNLCLREVCFNCRYSSLKKPSDITMADFWGIDKLIPELDDGKGCSLVVCNSVLGVSFMENINNSLVIAVNKEDAISCQVNAHQASTPGELKENFWVDYINKGFPFVLDKYFGYSAKGRIKGYIKRILFKLRMRYLY